MESFAVQSGAMPSSSVQPNHGYHYKQEETKLWYENQYLADSGIQSGASNTSSVYSHPTGDGSEDMETSYPTCPEMRHGYNPPVNNLHHHTIPMERSVGVACGSSFPAQQNYYHPQSPHPQLATRVPIQTKIDAINPTMPRLQNGYPEPQRPPPYPQQQMRQQPPPAYGVPNVMIGQGHQFQQRPKTVAPLANENQKNDVVRNMDDLMKMMIDPDQEIVAGAIQVLDQMSQNKQKVAQIASSPGALSAIFATLRIINSPQPNQVVMKFLYDVSSLTAGQEGILSHGGVPFLIQKLSAHLPQIINNYIIAIIHNLIQPDRLECSKRAKHEITQNRGVEALVAALDSNNAKFLNLVCECLKLLTTRDESIKLRVFHSNGVPKLLRLFTVSQDEKLLYTVSFVLKNISVEPHNKHAIVELDGLEILSSCLRNCTFSTSRVPIAILTVFRNMSDMIATDPQFKDRKLDGLLEVVVPFLTKRTEDGKVHPLLIYAAGILSNLTSGAPRNKIKVCQLNGIQLLVQACQSYPNDDNLLETCFCTLRHLITRHPEIQQARDLLLNVGGLELLGNTLLHPDRTRMDVVKAVVSCVQPLSQVPRTHIILRNRGIFQRLLDLMREVFIAVYQTNYDPNSAWSFPVGTGSTTVRMSDLLSGIIGTLSNFSDESSVRDMIRHQDLIPMIIELLNRYPVENVLRACVALTLKVAHDPEGASLLENNRAREGLFRLIQRPASNDNSNQETARHAALTIAKIYEGKPEHLQIEITSTLNQIMDSSGYGMAWRSHPTPMAYEYLSHMDDFRNYHSSGPPSVYGGSVYSSNVSAYDPDNLSGMDMPPYTPNPPQQHWDNNYSTPTPRDHSLQSSMYQNMNNDGMH